MVGSADDHTQVEAVFGSTRAQSCQPLQKKATVLLLSKTLSGDHQRLRERSFLAILRSAHQKAGCLSPRNCVLRRRKLAHRVHDFSA
mmetsp:Transcript_22115/g.39593  ORF Transcript_22115/g.39593 Transcript_22115/m.39593 type:complete len:87 (+) Transcript_22115:1059-1319(+)